MLYVMTESRIAVVHSSGRWVYQCTHRWQLCCMELVRCCQTQVRACDTLRSVYWWLCLSVCLSVSLSVCLSVSLSLCTFAVVNV